MQTFTKYSPGTTYVTVEGELYEQVCKNEIIIHKSRKQKTQAVSKSIT